jgi:hypothetical protein
MARHPADVGGAPVEVAVLEVEDVLARDVHSGEVAGGRVLNALWLSGRSGGVQNEEGVFGGERRGVLRERAALFARRCGEKIVPPDVAPLSHRDGAVSVDVVLVQAPEDDDFLDRRGLCHRLVRHVLQRDDVAAPPRPVLREEYLAFRVIDAIAERVGAEPTEDDRVRRADSRAGEHRDRRLGNHPHVDRDAVACDDTEACERPCETHHFPVKLEVRKRARLSGFPFPHDGCSRARRGFEVAIEAALGEIELRPVEEARLRQIPREKLRPRLAPHEVARLLAPKLLRLLDRLPVERCVFGMGLDAGTPSELCAREKAALLFQA